MELPKAFCMYSVTGSALKQWPLLSSAILQFIGISQMVALHWSAFIVRLCIKLLEFWC